MTFVHELARSVRPSTFRKKLEQMDFLVTIEEISSYGNDWIDYCQYKFGDKIKGTIDEAREFCNYYPKIQITAFKLENDRIEYYITQSDYGYNELHIKVRGRFESVFPPKDKTIKIKGINSKKVEELVDQLEKYLQDENIPIYVDPRRNTVRLVINNMVILTIKQGNIVYGSELYPRCIDDILDNGFGFKEFSNDLYQKIFVGGNI